MQHKKTIKKTWITAYDMFSARVAVSAGVDVLLVGDSLGMTVYGDDDTKSVTPEMMRRHFLAVKKYATDTPVVLDFPIGGADSLEQGKETFSYFASAGASVVKVEGGTEMISLFRWIMEQGGEVVGHLGLQPQHSDWRVHGKTDAEFDMILETVKQFDDLGMTKIVLECVPEPLGKMAQEIFSGDIVGIGAGRFVNAQILVFDDVVGRTMEDFTPKFLRRFGDAFQEEKSSVCHFVDSVQSESFPNEGEVYY